MLKRFSNRNPEVVLSCLLSVIGEPGRIFEMSVSFLFLTCFVQGVGVAAFGPWFRRAIGDNFDPNGKSLVDHFLYFSNLP